MANSRRTSIPRCYATIYVRDLAAADWAERILDAAGVDRDRTWDYLPDRGDYMASVYAASLEERAEAEALLAEMERARLDVDWDGEWTETDE